MAATEPLVCHPPGACSLAVGPPGLATGATKAFWVFTGGADGRVLGRCVRSESSDQSTSIPERADFSWDTAQVGSFGTSAIRALALSPCGSFLVVSDEATRVQLLSVSSGEVVALLCRTPVPTSCVAFAATGEYVALGGGEPATIRLVHVNEESRIEILRASADDPAYDSIVEYSVIDLAMDPLGCYFVTVHEVASGRGDSSAAGKLEARSNVCLWSADAQQVLIYGLGHVRGARCARFSPDGQIVAIGDCAGRVQFIHRDSWAATVDDAFDIQSWLRARGPNATKAAVASSVVSMAWDTSSPPRLVLAARLDEEAGDSIIMYDSMRRQAREIFVAEAEIRALAVSPSSLHLYYIDLLGQLGTVALPAAQPLHAREQQLRPPKLRKKSSAVGPGGRKDHTQHGSFSAAIQRDPGSPTASAISSRSSRRTENASNAADLPSGSDSVDAGASELVDDSARVSSLSGPECSTADESDRNLETILQSRKRRHDSKRAREQRPCSCQFTAQEPFQIGSTLDWATKRRILQWTPVGCLASLPAGAVVATSDESARQIELEFTDASRRSVRFPDRYGFQYGALNAHAMFLAAKSSCDEARRAALVYYRPHESWSANSDWVRYLPLGEEPIALAIGKLWVAVATSTQLIRLYSFTGLVTDSFHPGLSGGILTLVASDDRLAILSRGSGLNDAGEFLLLRVHENGFVAECLANGRLPSPVSQMQPSRQRDRSLGVDRIVWAGLSDSREPSNSDAAEMPVSGNDPGLLWVYHASGNLYMLRPWTFGYYRSAAWAWEPRCHPLATIQRGSMHLTWHLALTSAGIQTMLERNVDGRPVNPSEEWFYPLGIRSFVLYGVPVARGLQSPAAYPRPQVLRLPLEYFSWPDIHDGQSSELEQSYLATATALRATQSYLFDAVAFEHASSVGGQTGAIQALAQKARQLQRQADKLLLYLIEQACETQRDRRVMDLVSRLSSVKGFKLAVQIANRLKRAILADKITKLADARLDELGDTDSLVEQLTRANRCDVSVAPSAKNCATEESTELTRGFAQEVANGSAEELPAGAEQSLETTRHSGSEQFELERAPAAAHVRAGPSVRAAAAATTTAAAVAAAGSVPKNAPRRLQIAERLLPLTRAQLDSDASGSARSQSLSSLATLGMQSK